MCDPLREFMIARNAPELTESSILLTTEVDDTPLSVTTSYITTTSESNLLPLTAAEYPDTLALTSKIEDTVSPSDLMKYGLDALPLVMFE